MRHLKEKGIAGETALNTWLKVNGLSYLYVNQEPDKFAPLFHENVKRPDFLVLLEAVGLIAVDAKNYTLSRGVYTLELEEEVKRVLTFERIFRIPVWYAYMDNLEGEDVWYWISALKAVEVGETRKNTKNGKEFLALPLKELELVRKNADLGKLYTHRLPGVANIKVRAT